MLIVCFLKQQFLYFFPLPHGQGSFLPILLTKFLFIQYLNAYALVPPPPCLSFVTMKSATLPSVPLTAKITFRILPLLSLLQLSQSLCLFVLASSHPHFLQYLISVFSSLFMAIIIASVFCASRKKFLHLMFFNLSGHIKCCYTVRNICKFVYYLDSLLR